MRPEDDAALVRSLDDARLSRGERQALVGLAANLTPEARAAMTRRAFEIARQALAGPDERLIVDWLEGVTLAIRDRPAESPNENRAEAHFSPGVDCPRTILQLLASASRSLDACVFTITDDQLADALIASHRRGIAVRVITDDSKAEDLGSDIHRLEREGVAVRVDRSPFHMHHKFAVIDGSTLLTGSYNWTRGASRDNEENLVVVADPRLVGPFRATFDRLWKKFA